MMLKQDLEFCIGQAAKLNVARVKVLQLKEGSVLVEFSVRPGEGEDAREQEAILRELQDSIRDDSCLLRFKYRAIKVCFADEQLQEGSGNELSHKEKRQRTLMQRFFGARWRGKEEAAGTGMERREVKEQDISNSMFDVHVDFDEHPSAILHVRLVKASHLPTLEWTRAFCVLRLQDASASAWSSNEHLEPESLLPCSSERVSSIAEGEHAKFEEDFAFGVSESKETTLSVRVFHKGYIATELIGEALVPLSSLLTSSRSPPPSPPRSFWFPLKTLAGGDVKHSSGVRSELKLEFSWTRPVPDQLRVLKEQLIKLVVEEEAQPDWQPRVFVLDPFSRFLYEYVGKERASSLLPSHPDLPAEVAELPGNAFRVSSGSSSLTCRAATKSARRTWVEGLRLAATLKKEPPASTGRRWLLLLLAFLVVGLGVGLAVWKLAFSPAPLPPPALTWTICGRGESECEACRCFSRCLFASSLGFQLPITDEDLICSALCACSVPPLRRGCGDGIRRNMTLQALGVRFSAQEECDDGNNKNQDGCSATCQLENYMKTDALNSVPPQLGVSLCGNSHSLAACEEACLLSSSCQCVSYGGGWCHLFSNCSSIVPVASLSSRPALADPWEEMEFACGEGKYVPSQLSVDVRGTILLVGVATLQEGEANVLEDAFQNRSLVPAAYSFQLISSSPGSLSTRDALPARRAGSSALRADIPVVAVRFKVTVSVSSGLALRAALVSFVNAGEQGLAGALKLRGLRSLLNAIWPPSDPLPSVFPSPLYYSGSSTLLLKQPWRCYPGGNRFDPSSSADLCCGNVSQVCHPPASCYVSTADDFLCIPKREPRAPTGLVGSAMDQQVMLGWKSPGDTGGLAIDGYGVEVSEFTIGASSYRWVTRSTGSNATSLLVAGLSNFISYHFRVAAINQLGSSSTVRTVLPIQPTVTVPNRPRAGRAKAGHLRAWLAWDPPTSDGGAPILRFLLYITNETQPPRAWSLLQPGPSLQLGLLPPGGASDYPISATASIRRSTPRADASQTLRFLVTGDQNQRPLLTGVQYAFALVAQNAQGSSQQSDTLLVTPGFEPPALVSDLSALCHGGGAAGSCQSGQAGDQEVSIGWRPPSEDGGQAVRSYLVEVSSNASFSLLDAQQLVPANETSRSVLGLVNGVSYYVRVRAVNEVGEGAAAAIGPLVPTACIPLGTECTSCSQPFLQVWGKCSFPACFQLGNSTKDTRLLDCSPAGCKLEVQHEGAWGYVGASDFSELSADIACRSLGLRARPVVCGGGTCGSVVDVQLLSPARVWLEGVQCTGEETSIVDCPASQRLDSTGTLTKWGGISSSSVVGLCCWSKL
eukprot:762624-Hanusia_phi.AAC.5